MGIIYTGGGIKLFLAKHWNYPGANFRVCIHTRLYMKKHILTQTIWFKIHSGSSTLFFQT